MAFSLGCQQQLPYQLAMLNEKNLVMGGSWSKVATKTSPFEFITKPRFEKRHPNLAIIIPALHVKISQGFGLISMFYLGVGGTHSLIKFL